MKKPFKKLFGYRVYLLAPKVDSKNIHLSEEAKRELMKSKVKDFMRLRVYAVGTSVETVKEGDEVLVENVTNAPVIELADDLSVILVDVHNIVHIW